MAGILQQTNKFHKSVRYFSLEETRYKFQQYQKYCRIAFFVCCFSLFISPFFSLFFLCLFVVRTSNQLFYTFFRNENYIRQYATILQPQTAQKVVSVIGYRIYDGELDSHLSIIKSGNTSALANKQKAMEREVNKVRHIGLDSKVAKTHIALIGKTGAGKTECIRSISEDVLLSGGGIFFNDGKSDVKMLDEFMNQAKKCGRETSVKVLNFLKAEKSAESNTFNFFNNQHPIKLVEFLSNLAFKESSDGNTAYFQNRGKALLLPVVSALYLRNNYSNEGLDSEKIRDNLDITKLSSLYITFYCMCRDIDKIISNNKEVLTLINDNTIIVPETYYFNHIERLLAIIIQEPTKKIEIEQKLGIDYAFIRECYTNVYKTLDGYVGMVWNRFSPMLMNLSLVIYGLGKSKNKTFYSIDGKDTYSSSEIKYFYNEVKQAFLDIPKEQLLSNNEELNNKIPEFIKKFSNTEITSDKDVFATLKEAFKTSNGSLEDPPADAVQQHAYAQQQWEALFNIFTAFKHIVAQSQSEIDPIEVVKENQILYVLLPPLELSKSQVEILGKIVIMTIKSFAGNALGGEFIGTHQTIKNIAKDIFTPKPFTLVVLDEYGAYPVGDLDTILAQVRSLNMSVVLGIQDLVSLKTGGNDDTAQKRALANTTKIVFKIADEDTIRWLEVMVADQEVETSDYKKDASGELVLDPNVRLQKEKIVPIKKTQDADNGFCLMLLGSENDRALWCQTFFRGGSKGNTRLIRTNPIKGLKNTNIISNQLKGSEAFIEILDEEFKKAQ